MKLIEVKRSFNQKLGEGQALIELVDITNHNVYNTGGDYGILMAKHILEFDTSTDNYKECIEFVRNALNPKNDDRFQIRFL